MKKIFLLIFFLTPVLLPQSFIPQGNGYTFSFDLKYGGEATSDSTQVIDFDMQYGSAIELFVEGNANDPVDSFYIRSGGKEILVWGVTPSDTNWGNYTLLSDSGFNNINSPIVNSARGKHFFINQPLVDLLEFGILNHRGTLVTRTIEFTIKAIKTLITQ